MDQSEIEAAAGDIASLAAELAGETERLRRLPDRLVRRLRDSGLLTAGVPRELGGLELDPGTALRCAEQIARADASAGWCVSIAITSSLLAAYLPVEARSELFDAGQVAGGVWAPRGRARRIDGRVDGRVDGGVVVSGRWAFCSGVSHADVLFLGCLIDAGPTDSGPRERQAPSVVAVPKGDVAVLDTWHTLGLRGTGSHDVVADEVFVPAGRVFSLFDGPLVDRPLYRFPPFGFFALSVAVPALGNATGAIDDLVALAGAKVGLGSSRTLAERATTQAAVAAAESSRRAARGLFYGAVDAAWKASHLDEPVPLPLRNDLRLAATHAARTSAGIVSSMYDLAGGSAIYDGAPLQRRFRDAHTATAHFQVNETSRELPGRILLGLPADASTL